MTEKTPTEAEERVAIFKALEQIFLHSRANTEFLSALQSELAGVRAHTETTVKLFDEAHSAAIIDREVGARKELISFLLEKSHQYIVLIMAGFYTAAFALLGIVSERLRDDELRLSALLLTFSLSAFVLWEIASVCWMGFHVMKGDMGLVQKAPRWIQLGWPIAMFLALATGVPALVLSGYAYLRGLGVLNFGYISF